MQPVTDPTLLAQLNGAENQAGGINWWAMAGFVVMTQEARHSHPTGCAAVKKWPCQKRQMGKYLHPDRGSSAKPRSRATRGGGI